MKKYAIFAMCLFASNIFAATTTVEKLDAKPQNMTALKGSPIHLQSYHYAQVRNDTDSVKTIYMNYYFCAEGKECVAKRFKVKVNPHGTWHDHITLHMNANYKFAGHYQLTATTSVDGDASGDYTGFGTVTVN